MVRSSCFTLFATGQDSTSQSHLAKVDRVSVLRVGAWLAGSPPMTARRLFSRQMASALLQLASACDLIQPAIQRRGPKSPYPANLDRTRLPHPQDLTAPACALNSAFTVRNDSSEKS